MSFAEKFDELLKASHGIFSIGHFHIETELDNVQACRLNVERY